MAEERELLTILSEKEYKDLLARLEKEFGKPRTQRRLSLQSSNFDQTDMDTRIRITDGKAELMQKIGDWKNITKGEARNEISIVLQNDSQMIFDLYKIIRNLFQGTKVENIIMQFESKIWETKAFEIKVSRQFGKSDAYNCEVEALNTLLKPQNLIRKLKIPVHLPAQSTNFWRRWNERVNLSVSELSDKDLLKIIGEYL